MFHKRRDISWRAEWLSACEIRLYSIDLIPHADDYRSAIRKLCAALAPNCHWWNDRAHSIFRLVRDVTDKEFIWMSADWLSLWTAWCELSCDPCARTNDRFKIIVKKGFRKLDFCYFSSFSLFLSFTRIHQISLQFVLHEVMVLAVSIWYVNSYLNRLLKIARGGVELLT